ncbi:MAG: radical SAM protein [Candidatus Alcyoniella australis]|nr:radical SAM protein [Candidatus Alcyoniella australis]
MRVLLVKPRELSDSIQPNLGLGFLAAALSERHQVELFDAIRLHAKPARLASKIESFRPKLIGFQVNTYGRRLDLPYIQTARNAAPNATIVLGGADPSADPAGAWEFYGDLVDWMIRGEAENALPALIELIANNSSDYASVAGLVRRTDAGIESNPLDRVDLAQVPLPRWDLLRPDLAPPAPQGAFYRATPLAPISISRGCPHPCTFCGASAISGRRVRYRPLESVIEEIELLRRDYGINEIHVVDDNFTHDGDYVRAFCERILAGPRLWWLCPNGLRIDTLDRELVRLMFRAGCYSMNLGIESGSNRMLSLIRKNLTVEQVRSTAQMLHEEGFLLRGFFLYGFPTETRQERRQSLKLAMELPLAVGHFMLFHPFPGTSAYEALECGDYAGTWRRDAPTLAEVAFVPEGTTASRLKNEQRWALLRFHARPRVIIEILRNVRGPRHLVYLLLRIMRWLVGV